MRSSLCTRQTKVKLRVIHFVRRATKDGSRHCVEEQHKVQPPLSQFISIRVVFPHLFRCCVKPVYVLSWKFIAIFLLCSCRRVTRRRTTTTWPTRTWTRPRSTAATTVTILLYLFVLLLLFSFCYVFARLSIALTFGNICLFSTKCHLTLTQGQVHQRRRKECPNHFSRRPLAAFSS